jgi:putative PIG3 family NAD(P)H quinone oxidoreductase
VWLILSEWVRYATSMRVVRAIRPGGPEVLEVCQSPEPVPGPGELLLAVAATALNRADLLQCRGLYPAPAGVSDVLGLECAGTVIGAGPNTPSAAEWLGRRVMALLPGGGYAERVTLPVELCLPVPESLSFTEAAAIPEAFLTAQEALFTLGALKPLETVLIHAGASGVGSASIQLARAVGARVIATAGSAEKCAQVSALGAHAILRHSAPWAETLAAHLAETNNRGIDVIIDLVGAKALKDNLQLLNPAGRLVCVGLLGGTEATLDLALVLRKRLQILGLVMRSRSLRDKIAITRRFEREWLPRFGEELAPIIDSVFALSDVRAAHERMAANANTGKIVLLIAKPEA